MRLMKKIIPFSVAASMAFALLACGSSDPSVAETTGETASQAESPASSEDGSNTADGTDTDEKNDAGDKALTDGEAASEETEEAENPDIPDSPNDNPFGLVYDGAITENVDGEVNIHPVSYEINGVKIAANVYTPAGYDEKADKKYPAVTVAHPNGGVKEQVSGLFAQKLAENGYIAIACDAAYQGASGGEPRNLDTPANRVEDVHAMVDYISNYPGVDTERIGMLGICGGGGYTIKAAQTEKRAKAVATLSMFNTGIVRLYGLGNSEEDTIEERLAAAAEARAEEARTGETVYPAPRGEITQEYIDSLPDGLYKDGMYYYGQDYAHPNSGGQVPVKCLLDLVDFDARHNMELITQPLLMMAGSEADTLYMTEDCFELATGTEEKELFIIDGARHIQTYFVPEYVDQETDKLLDFFGQYL